MSWGRTLQQGAWVRFEQDGETLIGVLDGDAVHVHDGTLFAARPAGLTVPVQDVRLLTPVTPGKVIGLWNNFHALAEKTGAAIPDVPLYFLKAPSSLVPDGATVSAPPGYAGRVVYEGELAIVIGRMCRQVDEAGAAAAIFGYTCANDLTALDWLTSDPAFPQWARAKGCDGFGPIGPGIVPHVDLLTARVRTAVNGRVRQDYPLSDMILPPARIVSLLSQEMTLEPGDVILCGTSVGVLPVRPGMALAVSIDGIGTLNTIIGQAPSLAQRSA